MWVWDHQGTYGLTPCFQSCHLRPRNFEGAGPAHVLRHVHLQSPSPVATEAASKTPFVSRWPTKCSITVIVEPTWVSAAACLVLQTSSVVYLLALSAECRQFWGLTKGPLSMKLQVFPPCRGMASCPFKFSFAGSLKTAKLSRVPCSTAWPLEVV